jgi:hypothetical protein
MEYLNGWVSPEGNYYSCTYKEHSKEADLIEEKLKLISKQNKWGFIVHGEALLEILNWIKITTSPWGDGHIFKYCELDCKEIITDQQSRFLENIYDLLTEKQKDDYQMILYRCGRLEL